MDCIEVRNRLSDFKDDSLSKTSKDEIRSHLSGCAECSAVASSLEAVREGLRQLPPMVAPPELLEKIQEAISRETRLPDATAPKDNADVKPRSAGSRWKFPLEAAAAILLFASIGWYMAGTPSGKDTRQAKLSAQSHAPATAETEDSLPMSEPMLAEAAPDSAENTSEIQMPAVPINQASAQTARVYSQVADEPSPSAQPAVRANQSAERSPATRANQSAERSIATLPEDISDPKVRVYSLADLPAVPILRASTRFARVRPYIPANTAETKPARSEAKAAPESEAPDAELLTIRPPVPYGLEISVETTLEERQETAERIAKTAKRLGGTVEKMDRAAVPEGIVTVRVLLPERTAQAFIEDLWQNGRLSPEGMPSRSILPVGPKPGIIAYTVYLHSH
ncbi:MAG: zf-HC2 domain-containing protein [Syntrophorhabdaceae bacterium]|nr:zf-HC2 domain-containing protein [Syntrophorhabdaceae bacterium]